MNSPKHLSPRIRAFGCSIFKTLRKTTVREHRRKCGGDIVFTNAKLRDQGIENEDDDQIFT